jgi:hypothetical protein
VSELHRSPEMLQDQASSIEAYERFVDRVVASRTVWTLRSPDGGCAQCPSHEREDQSVLVFWSDRAYAQRHCSSSWSTYVPEEISIRMFVRRWLKDMHRRDCLVGPNWDAHLAGVEVAPRDLEERIRSKGGPDVSKEIDRPWWKLW